MSSFLNSFNSKFVKVTFCFLALLLTVSLIYATPVKAVSKREELNKKLDSLKGDIESSRKEFNSLDSQKKDLKEQVQSTKNEIEKIETLLQETQKVIDNLNLEIPITEKNIKDTEDKIYKIYKEIQYLSTTSKIEQIMGSNSFTDLVSNLYGLSSAQEEANRLQIVLEQDLAQLKEQKEAQESLLKTQQQAKYLLNSKKSTLEQLIKDTENKQEEYDKKIKEQLSQADKVKADLAALPEDVRTYIYNNGGNPNYAGGPNYDGPCYFNEQRPLNAPAGYFAQPTTGYWSDNFSCYPWSFSWRQNGHDGIDIANGFGTPLVSTAPGTVVKVYTTSTSNVNALVIKHTLPSGQRVYSGYWHLNRPPAVSVGQYVERNQYIGDMGSTGFSTGSHLHFMIISDTYEQWGEGCAYGNKRAKCYNPAPLIGW
jgi:murein DD-endopeptidase MepM/ murein hydrolase activator NlpD